MSKKKSGNNRRTKNIEDSEPAYDIAAIAAAAFGGDQEAVALLEELADEGDPSAMVFADVLADYTEEDNPDDEASDFDEFDFDEENG